MSGFDNMNVIVVPTKYGELTLIKTSTGIDVVYKCGDKTYEDHCDFPSVVADFLKSRKPVDTNLIKDIKDHYNAVEGVYG